jgi:hypothetical protein
VRPEPKLCRTGGRVKGAERNVGDYKKRALRPGQRCMRKKDLRDWYLRMKEGDIFVNWLSQSMGSRKGVVTREESPAWIGTQIRIHNLDNKRIKEDIIIEVFGVF